MNIATGLEAFASLKEKPIKVTYATTIAASRKAPAKRVPGLHLTLGYTWPEGQPTPVPIILLENPIIPLDMVDCSKGAVPSKDGDRLVISIMQSDLAEFLPAGMYLVARAAIGPSGREFDGEVSSLVGDETGKPAYAWSGTAQAAHDDAIAMIHAVTAWRFANGLV
jgi:hypothetical protein